MKHCCLGMDSALTSYGSPFRYVPYEREYHVEYNSTFENSETGEIDLGVVAGIRYCPWCGSKLPRDLSEEWEREVTSKFNVSDALDKEELKKIPQEYMTEEWWRKRGL